MVVSIWLYMLFLSVEDMRLPIMEGVEKSTIESMNDELGLSVSSGRLRNSAAKSAGENGSSSGYTSSSGEGDLQEEEAESLTRAGVERPELQCESS